jgi:hypothetical protein
MWHLGVISTLENIKLERKALRKNCRTKLALCKSAYEIHQPNIHLDRLLTTSTKYVSFASTSLY